MQNTIVAGLLMDENITITSVEICQKHHIPEAWLLELIEQGLFGEINAPFNELQLNLTMLKRLQKAHRIQHDLDINSSGIVVVMELLDELEQLRNELHVLRHHVNTA